MSVTKAGAWSTVMDRWTWGGGRVPVPGGLVGVDHAGTGAGIGDGGAVGAGHGAGCCGAGRVDGEDHRVARGAAGRWEGDLPADDAGARAGKADRLRVQGVQLRDPAAVGVRDPDVGAIGGHSEGETAHGSGRAVHRAGGGVQLGDRPVRVARVRDPHVDAIGGDPVKEPLPRGIVLMAVPVAASSSVTVPSLF